MWTFGVRRKGRLIIGSCCLWFLVSGGDGKWSQDLGRGSENGGGGGRGGLGQAVKCQDPMNGGGGQLEKLSRTSFQIVQVR